MKFAFLVEDRVVTAEVEEGKHGYQVIVGGEQASLEVTDTEPGELRLRTGGREVVAHWAVNGSARWVHLNGRTWRLEALPVSRRRPAEAHSAEDELRAPMPGQVRAVQAAAGAVVERGQTLIVLEAMKMELLIQAPRSGRVAEVLVSAGQTVERDQVLARME